ncbi:MAG: adenylate cyclase [Actinomycetota bacterium]|jgi:class 3 adenylate cyclase
MIVGRDRYGTELVANSTLWIAIIVGGGAFGLAVAGNNLGINRPGVMALVVLCVAMAIAIRLVGPRGESLFFPIIALLAGAVQGGVVWFAGPRFGVTATLPAAYVAAATLFFSRRVAFGAGVLSLASFSAVMLFDEGYPRPWARIVLVTAATVATGTIVNRFVTNLERLARSERELHGQVAAANTKLRRFLAPQVADTVMSVGGEEALATHRRQIAVIFVDLRGFTSFSAVAEPEDVVEVLTEFYAAVGAIAKRLEATVGSFAGDGVMAYFNDPFPCEDPAGRALDMATSLRLPMADLGERWSHRGFRIGYGVGIAYGYATLGTIGFEERSDYTPIGSAVNLASRLCDEAGNGEILLDGRAHEAVHEQVVAEPLELELKGFNGSVTAYRVTLK